MAQSKICTQWLVIDTKFTSLDVGGEKLNLLFYVDLPAVLGYATWFLKMNKTCACTHDVCYVGMYKVSVMAEQLKPSWADHFFPVGLHYYVGVVENAKKLIERRGTRLQPSVLLEREAPQESSLLYQWQQRKSWWRSYIQCNCYSSKLILLNLYHHL